MSKILKKVLSGQQGFTLIEMMAVMAILAVLVAIVAPAVTGTKNASIEAQTLSDATQVRTGAGKFFSAQNEAEVRTPHTVTLTTKINGSTVAATAQTISTRWPEKLITTASATLFPAAYADVFPTSISATNGKIVDVTLLDKDGSFITGATLLGSYTAVDVNKLVNGGHLSQMPEDLQFTNIVMAGVEIPNFLWLFKKTSSSTESTAVGDSREVTVFKLVKAEQVEEATAIAATTVKLTYKQIF